nr:MAG TPA: hypothetical protein [Caudoviricetes sp.]
MTNYNMDSLLLMLSLPFLLRYLFYILRGPALYKCLCYNSSIYHLWVQNADNLLYRNIYPALPLLHLN